MKKKMKILAEGEEEEQLEEIGEKQPQTTTATEEKAEGGPVNYLDIEKEEEEEDDSRHRKTPQPIEESKKLRIFSLIFLIFNLVLNLALNPSEEIVISVNTEDFTADSSAGHFVEKDVNEPVEKYQRKFSSPGHFQQQNFNLLNSDSPFAGLTRSLYLGNLPVGCSVRDICDVVRGDRGLESIRLLPAKSCAFIDFINRAGAERFITRLKRQRTRLQIGGQDVRIGWAKEKPLQATVLRAIENGATRNVYLNFPVPCPDRTDPLLHKFNDYLIDTINTSSEDYFLQSGENEISNLDYPLVSFLYGIFDEFGPLDMIKVVPSRRIAFIHMAQVADAMRAVAELPTRSEFRGKRLAFGRDRCGERENSIGYINNSHVNSAYVNNDIHSAHVNSGSENIFNTQLQPRHRTVYLGGCTAPDITIEDLCDHIHTGQLQSVRLNRDRKCAFITFIHAEAAENFLSMALQFGLTIRNCQLKPAYAKESGNEINSGSRDNRDYRDYRDSRDSITTASTSNTANTTNNHSNSLPLAIANALRKGYTRNLYLGNVDFSVLTEPRLRTEMSRFGPIDRVQILKDRGVAFVHFANLLDGGRAFEQIKSDVCYKNCRVGFGRDRCDSTSRANTHVNPSASSNFYHTAAMYSPYSYLPNYPPPPFYFHPMMYEPYAEVVKEEVQEQIQEEQEKQEK